MIAKALQNLKTKLYCFQYLPKIGFSFFCKLTAKTNCTILNTPTFAVPPTPALPVAVQKTRDDPSSMELRLTNRQYLDSGLHLDKKSLPEL